MITATQAESIIWNWVNSSPLKSAITGDVYRNVRPANSEKEDVVINSITATGSEFIIQDAVLNINIHIPRIQAYGNTMIPNNARFDAISQVVSDHLKEGYHRKLTWWVDYTGVINNELNNESFLNIRIRFKYHNNIS